MWVGAEIAVRRVESVGRAGRGAKSGIPEGGPVGKALGAGFPRHFYGSGIWSGAAGLCQLTLLDRDDVGLGMIGVSRPIAFVVFGLNA